MNASSKGKFQTSSSVSKASRDVHVVSFAIKPSSFQLKSALQALVFAWFATKATIGSVECVMFADPAHGIAVCYAVGGWAKVAILKK